MKKHPIQPLEKDERGVMRFKRNHIVCHLLEKGGISLNEIACLDFSKEDREQFAQLIGYSLGGFADLSYVSVETFCEAKKKAETEMIDEEARIETLVETVEELRAILLTTVRAALPYIDREQLDI